VGKIQGTIVDYLMPPLSTGELIAGLVGASVTRAILVGAAVWLAMLFWPGVHVTPSHPFAILWFGLMGSAMLAFLGLLTSIWAEKFDHAAAVSNFVVAPLSLLSGHFLFDRKPLARIPGGEPRQSLLLHHLRLPLRVPRSGGLAGDPGRASSSCHQPGARGPLLRADPPGLEAQELIRG
jgi:hypothetical protein